MMAGGTGENHLSTRKARGTFGSVPVMLTGMSCPLDCPTETASYLLATASNDANASEMEVYAHTKGCDVIV